MIIYFSASARNITKDIIKYREIIHVIRSLGHSIANDWTETAHLIAKHKRTWELDTIVKEADVGVESAELIIVEASGASTFGVGYELAQALKHKKPTLALVNKAQTGNSYAAALRDDSLVVKSYTADTLKEIIERFIEDNAITTKDLRFNFVINRQIYNHLRKKSYSSGRTRAELVRDLLLKDMLEREKRA